MVVINVTVGDNIRTIRKEKGFTQKQLAEQTGLSVRSVQDFEYNKIVPKLETLLKIASVLQVSPRKINPSVQWDDYIDTEELSEESKLWEAIIKRYGEEPASTINDFLSLTDEGQQKASEYIDYLMQKYKK